VNRDFENQPLKFFSGINYEGGFMRKIIILTIFFASLFLSAHQTYAQQTKVLIILPRYFGLNHYLNMEMFESFGWEVTLTAVTHVVEPCPYSVGVGNTSRNVDIVISEINDITQYDCVAIAPMSWQYDPPNACIDLLNSQVALDLISTANDSGLVIWATCAGVRVLAAADVINGKNVQGQPGPGNIYLNEYLAAGANYLGSKLPPVIDGNIVTTTRGQYYMVQNNEAIMTALENVHVLKSKGGTNK